MPKVGLYRLHNLQIEYCTSTYFAGWASTSVLNLEESHVICWHQESRTLLIFTIDINLKSLQTDLNAYHCSSPSLSFSSAGGDVTSSL